MLEKAKKKSQDVGYEPGSPTMAVVCVREGATATLIGCFQ